MLVYLRIGRIVKLPQNHTTRNRLRQFFCFDTSERVQIVKEGKEPEINGESVLSAMRAVFASIESSETGKTVEIEANK